MTTSEYFNVLMTFKRKN